MSARHGPSESSRELGTLESLLGLSLIRIERGRAMTTRRSRTQSVSDVPRLDVTRCQFITGDALDELRKLKSGTINTIITSPAYWPIKLTYGGAGIGYEATVAEYLSNIVTIMHDAKRVLKDTGTLWIVIGDSYSVPPKFVDATNRHPETSRFAKAFLAGSHTHPGWRQTNRQSPDDPVATCDCFAR